MTDILIYTQQAINTAHEFLMQPICLISPKQNT